MQSAVLGLEPILLWQHFSAISSIPRPSKKEEAVSAYVVNAAHRLGCEVLKDQVGNLVLRKKASPGRERAPSVCLQGHLDMVCEKNKETVHDFDRDPLLLRREGGLIKATGTTLGADNGIAIAAALAILEDPTAVHGPLECLLTIDEETGLTGAKNLDGSLLQSRILLNLDSEEEGSLYIGCSGGRDTLGTVPLAWQTALPQAQTLHLRVNGLKGGHSGLDIDKQRGNALKILARALHLLQKHCGVQIASLEGGSKRNAIPREAEALCQIESQHWPKAQQLLEDLQGVLSRELLHADAEARIQAVLLAKPLDQVWSSVCQSRILALLSGLPHGVIKWSAEIEGLVQTSCNFGVVTQGEHELKIATSQRSSLHSEMAEIAHATACVLSLAGARLEAKEGYPGWNPDLQSPLLQVAKRVFAKTYRHEAKIKAIHAGLECGLIGEKVPGMQMVSFGPSIRDAHSPDESLEIATVEPFYRYLKHLLAELSA